MKKKIFIPEPVAAAGENYLKEKGYQIVRGSGKFDKESLKKDIADCDAMLLSSLNIDREILEAGRKLVIVARHGAGYDNLDFRAAKELGIWATYSPDTTSISVAEFTIAAMLAFARKMEACSRELRKGNFQYKSANRGMEMAGKTLGIIGLGRIGRLVAKKAAYGLDMEILAYVPRPEGKEIPAYVRCVDWETLFGESDFISVHIPGGQKNRGLIGEKEFSIMKESACLVNVSRGGVMDEAAFCEAVKAGKIAGGVIDVFETEPPSSDNPLFALENVILTPHMASNTAECMAGIALDNAEDIHLALSGKKPRHVIGG